MRSTPALDRVKGAITTLFFSNSPSISNGLSNAQVAFSEIDDMRVLLQSSRHEERLGFHATSFMELLLNANNNSVWRFDKVVMPYDTHK
jgi:hypothetical protein